MRVHSESLRFVDEASDKETDRLPSAKKDDDPALYARAKQAYKVIKRRLGQTLGSESTRWTRDMATGRWREVGAWRDRVLAHPLLSALAQAVVWEAEREDGSRVLLRVSPEGEAHDAELDTVSLGDIARTRLAHPGSLGEERVRAWSEVFNDLELIAPIAQLVEPLTGDVDETLGRAFNFDTLDANRARGWQWFREGMLIKGMRLRHSDGEARVCFKLPFSLDKKGKPSHFSSSRLEIEAVELDPPLPLLRDEVHRLLSQD